MPRERITRRQKDISRLLRERKQMHRDKLKTRKIAAVIISIYLLANIYGCVTILAGAAGGAGTATWLSGKLSQQLDVSFEQAIQVVESGLKSLQLAITKKTVKKNIVQIMSEYRDGKTIWVDIRRISRYQSRVEVRVGVLADKQAAEEILSGIIKYQ